MINFLVSWFPGFLIKKKGEGENIGIIHNCIYEIK
jgi:hypothetical protein